MQDCSEYVLEEGKFAGCRLSDLDADELSFFLRRGLSSYEDRTQMRELMYESHQAQRWRPLGPSARRRRNRRSRRTIEQ